MQKRSRLSAGVSGTVEWCRSRRIWGDAAFFRRGCPEMSNGVEFAGLEERSHLSAGGSSSVAFAGFGKTKPSLGAGVEKCRMVSPSRGWKNEATVRAVPKSVADCRTDDSKNGASLRKWPRRVSRNVETAAQCGRSGIEYPYCRMGRSSGRTRPRQQDNLRTDIGGTGLSGTH
jgi:hypothetical protein